MTARRPEVATIARPQARRQPAGARPDLHVVADDAGVDLPRAERAVADLLAALGQDPSSEHLQDTPRRVAASYAELLTPPAFTLTTFPNDEGYDELVLAKAIPFHSLCQHHLLPFVGAAHVGYLPADRILGLSKLARVVELFARRLQVQERLTTQVADWLQTHLEPKGVGVVVEAEHLCMSLRGVRAAGARTVTSTLHGVLRDDPRSRQEFLALTRGDRLDRPDRRGVPRRPRGVRGHGRGEEAGDRTPTPGRGAGAARRGSR